VKTMCDVCSELCKQPAGSLIVQCKHFRREEWIAPTSDSPKSST